MPPAIASLLAASILLQDPTPDPFAEEPAPPPPPPCTERQVTCATGCFPLGSTCPSAGEVDPSTIRAPAPTARKTKVYDEQSEFSSNRRASASRRREGCDEPLGEWYARRLRVGLALGIPGAAMLAPPIYLAASGYLDPDLAPACAKGVAATFGVLGGILVITALIAPRLMQRHTVTCGASTCSLALRF